eukprot:SAG11_NODE_616_length_8192_cov_9.386136_8_plen_195_part_00
MLSKFTLRASATAPTWMRATHGVRAFRATAAQHDKIVLVLYPDPTTGYPPTYARSSVPDIDVYPDGQTTPTPSAIDFTPGDLLGCVSGELGLRKFVESLGHTLVVTSDKDGDNCELERELKDAHYVISQPFYPAYITSDRMANAPNLKAAITAGIGSDHVDLQAAMDNNVGITTITVAMKRFLASLFSCSRERR